MTPCTTLSIKPENRGKAPEVTKMSFIYTICINPAPAEILKVKHEMHMRTSYLLNQRDARDRRKCLNYYRLCLHRRKVKMMIHKYAATLECMNINNSHVALPPGLSIVEPITLSLKEITPLIPCMQVTRELS